MIKKITSAFFVLAMIIFAACEDSGNANNFTVSGKIENAPSKSIVLEQVQFDNTPPVVIDSATIADNGDYSLKGTAKEQGLYLISMDKMPLAIFINDNGNIKLSVDLQRNSRLPYISNSKATESLYEFLNGFRAKDSTLAVTYDAMDSIYSQNPSDSNLLVLQEKGNREMQHINSYMTDFIKNSSSPAAVFYALNMAATRNTMQPEQVDSLASAASDRFKSHAGLATFKSLYATAAAAHSPSSYILLNQQAPDLTMQDVNGKPMSISQFKGKYLLVDFWASWCGPCRQENPNVVATYNKFKGKNFEILGVSLDQDKKAWIDAIKADNLNWPQMSDLKQWNSISVETYKFDGIPFNVLIDPDGKIIASSLRGPQLEQTLSQVLK